MADNLIIPNRNEELVDFERRPTVRVHRFFNSLKTLISNPMVVITDVSTGSADADIIALEDKINEILAGLKAVGLMDT